MQPGELHKVESSTLLRFARATRKFPWPSVAVEMRIGPIVSMLAQKNEDEV